MRGSKLAWSRHAVALPLNPGLTRQHGHMAAPRGLQRRPRVSGVTITEKSYTLAQPTVENVDSSARTAGIAPSYYLELLLRWAERNNGGSLPTDLSDLRAEDVATAARVRKEQRMSAA